MNQNIFMFQNVKRPHYNVKCDRTYLIGFSKQNLIDRVSKKGDFKDIKSYTVSTKSNYTASIKTKMMDYGVCPDKLDKIEGHEAYIIVPNRNMVEEQEDVYACIPTHEYYFYMQLIEARKPLALIYDYCYDTINTQTFKAILFQGDVDGDVSL